jgi:hypothetical protein
LLLATPVAAYGQVNVNFTTGNTPVAAMNIIVGQGGYISYPPAVITTTNVWEVEMSGWIELSAVANYLFTATHGGGSYIRIARASTTSVSAIVFDAVNTDTVTAAGVTSGIHTVKVTSDAGFIKIFWDGTEVDSVARTANLGAIAMSGNLFMQSNSMPYASYIKVSVGGVSTIWYQPVAVVLGGVYAVGTVTVTNGDATVEGVGTTTWTQGMVGSVFRSTDGVVYTVASVTDADTLELAVVYGGGTLVGQAYTLNPRLPDRQGAEQNGAIVWGANPAGIAMVISSLSSYGGAFTDTSDTTPPDRLTEVTVSDWYGDGTITKAATLTNPFRGLVTMVSDNTTLTEIQTWRWYGMGILVVAVAIFSKLARGHQGITAIATGAIIGLLIAFDASIFPIYLAVLSAGLIIGGVVSERSHQL